MGKAGQSFYDLFNLLGKRGSGGGGGTFVRDSGSLEPAFVTWSAKHNKYVYIYIYTDSAQPLTTQDPEIDPTNPNHPNENW